MLICDAFFLLSLITPVDYMLFPVNCFWYINFSNLLFTKVYALQTPAIFNFTVY